MICPSCSLPAIAIVTHTVTIQIVDRNGALQPRVLSARQCLSCGGADSVQAVEREATLAEVKATRSKR